MINDNKKKKKNSNKSNKYKWNNKKREAWHAVDAREVHGLGISLLNEHGTQHGPGAPLLPKATYVYIHI